MKRTFVWLALCSSLLLACHPNPKKGALLEEGVSWELAKARKEVLSDVKYRLHFIIPEDKEDAIVGNEQVQFTYAKSEASGPLLMDFKGEPDQLKALKVNGVEASIDFEKEHILLPDDQLKEGVNTVVYEFVAGNEALNRREGYLYTLFVPDRARSAFPNFEQPNLKATFKLQLTIPADWEAIANGAVEQVEKGETHKVYHFSTTQKLPTYLFSFVAGKFQIATSSWRGKTISLFYRESDKEKIEASVDRIFEDYKKYISFYEQWTGIPYPFQEYGMVSIPDFQFGGMEHPGAILLKHSTLFLPNEATQNQLDSRDHLIAHEVAHQWFGDMVTMNWFDDVWTKEVYANFMAGKATADQEDAAESQLKFIVDHFPGAYAVDRTSGANPIHAQLDNLQDANSMYGAIIYQKAPIMMQQLESLMGVDNFQRGLRKYLKKYAFDNATWDDLIHILNQETTEDLLSWNEVWVNTPGRPVFKDSLVNEGDKIKALYLRQVDLSGQDRVWPQSFSIGLVYPDSTRVIRVKDTVQNQSIEEVKGADLPLLIWYNTTGLGYGVMPGHAYGFQEMWNLSDAYNRAAQYITMYENMLEGRYLTPGAVLNVFLSGLKKEQEERNIALLGNYIAKIYWVFMGPEMRKAVNANLEEKIWEALQYQTPSNNKKELFKIYERVFESSDALERLYAVWEKQRPPQGIHLREEDYTELGYALLLRKEFPGLLDQQLERIQNPDRKRRFQIIRPALSTKALVRDNFFKSLKEQKNRTDEAAILEALRLLHHPLRQKDTEKYLEQALAWLPEIQRTGSLFFPERWVQANFSQYNSATANQLVQDFLEAHKELNPKLKEKILQATDNLRRAQKLKK